MSQTYAFCVTNLNSQDNISLTLLLPFYLPNTSAPANEHTRGTLFLSHKYLLTSPASRIFSPHHSLSPETSSPPHQRSSYVSTALSSPLLKTRTTWHAERLDSTFTTKLKASPPSPSVHGPKIFDYLSI
jgi:hypothetical protein